MPAAKPNAPRFLSGIILAAGTSTRMGRPKQLLTLGDRPLLQRVLDEAASSCLDEVILVLGHRAPAIRRAIRIPEGVPVRVVVNPDFAQGQSASLRLGLRSADERAEAAVVLLGDQPGIRSELIERVAKAFTTTGSAAVRPVYRRSDGSREPGHPVLLARRTWPEVEKLRGDHGARALFSKHPDWLLEIPVDDEPPGDIDTREDYERALADAQARATADSEAVRH